MCAKRKWDMSNEWGPSGPSYTPYGYRSIADEEIRKEQAQREFEEVLLKAIEQSLHL